MSLEENRSALKLITSSQRILYGYIYSLLGSRDAADEVLQETNAVLCDKIDEFDGRAKFSTWACRIAYFEVLAYRKRTNRDRLRFVDADLLDGLGAAALDAAEDADSRLPLLRACLDELPAHSRTLIEGRYEPGASVQSMSQHLGRSAAGVRVGLHRIRKLLLKCIERKTASER
jgi:RNA polymerase sigma-70 factor (ECF subfamily)